MTLLKKIIDLVSNQDEENELYNRVEKLKKQVLEDHAANKREQAEELKKTARYVEDEEECEHYLELAKVAEVQASKTELELKTRQEHLDVIAAIKSRRN